MPLVELSGLNISPDLVVNISDAVVNGTVIKRKAEVTKLEYSPRDKRVYIELLVVPYGRNVDGTYGERIPFGSVLDHLIADNNILVNSANGDILGYRDILLNSVMQPDGSVRIVEDPSLTEINYAGEYDFFKILAATQPVVVDDLIKARIIRKYGAA